MEFHQLRYFVAVADHGNFTRAAESCLVAQPSLSQQIIKLEKELGRPLFDRLGRTARLTDAGRVLYEQAVSVLANVEDAKRRVSGADGAAAGRIAVGAIPTIAPYLLPPILRDFRRAYPRAEIAVQEDYTEHTIKSCLTGELDLAILALPVEHEQLHVEPLYREELLLATAAQHPLARQRRVTLADIQGQPFILLSETHCLGEQIVSFCRQEECSPSIRCRSAQLLTVQELVALRHGVSLIPEMAAAADKSKRCKYRSLSGDRPTRTLAVIWHKHRFQTPLVREFLSLVRQYRPKPSAATSGGG